MSRVRRFDDDVPFGSGEPRSRRERSAKHKKRKPDLNEEDSPRRKNAIRSRAGDRLFDEEDDFDGFDDEGEEAGEDDSVDEDDDLDADDDGIPADVAAELLERDGSDWDDDAGAGDEEDEWDGSWDEEEARWN